MELLIHYCNGDSASKCLADVRVVALSQQRSSGSARPRQTQTRLSPAEVKALVETYISGSLIKDVASQFGVHRATVTTILRREGIELRPVGLSDDNVTEAGRLYQSGWTLARLADKYDVDDMTIWRSLKKIGVAMRSPNARQ